MSKDKPVMVLNREEILAADDIQIELVEVPEWGGSVYVKGMTGSERDHFEASLFDVGSDPGKDTKMNLANMRAKLCSMSLCDKEGKKLFALKDVKELTKKSAAALQRVFLKAQKLSGITEEDIKE